MEHMKKKKGLATALMILFLTLSACSKTAQQGQMQQQTRQTGQMGVRPQDFCMADDDCACGVHKNTGECFYGNKEFVNASKQCPDFCTGIAAMFEIKCVENRCKQVRIK